MAAGKWIPAQFSGKYYWRPHKTGINSMLNSGTMVGISSNLFGGGYQQKTLKPFSWLMLIQEKITKYDIEKAVQTAKISMKRRKRFHDQNVREPPQISLQKRKIYS